MLIPEFAPQSGVLLTWPHRHSDWQPLLTAIEPVYDTLARAVTAQQHLLVICYDSEHRQHVQARLDAAGVPPDRAGLICVRTNDTWVRDYGPLCVRQDGKPVLLDFAFNAWGDKYSAALDDAVTGSLYAAGVFGTLACRRIPLVLEGGSIDVDDTGSLLTTSRCLLAPTRNPTLDRVALESALREHLGIERVLWLDHGELAGDDTDAHVDMLARFCDAQTIAYTQCPDADDPQHAALAAMERQLQSFRTAAGAPYRLVPLPLPRAVHAVDGSRLPASYANFLVINGALLLPVYDDPADDVAAQRLQACFPGRSIVRINCLPLIQQFGSLHCATMQLPAGVLKAASE
ncbi:MAG: agmatine deiminase family protein [Pseudomonadota bacterium]